MSLGSKIREARQSAGLSQAYVAEQLTVSTQAVSQWENDKTSPGGDKLYALSRIIGLKLDDPTTVAEMLPSPSFRRSEKESVSAPLVDYRKAEIWSEESVEGGIFPQSAFGEDTKYLEILWRPKGYVYAFEYNGIYMDPTFKRNDIIIIDTGRSPEEGDYVLAVLDKPEVLVAIYRPKGTDRHRAPIFDLDFPEDSLKGAIRVDGLNPGRVVGTVREHRRYYRRD